MPMYSYKCSSCEFILDDMSSIARRNDARKCPECGGEMALKIVPPMLNPVLGGGSFPGYECPVTGEFVTSRKRRKEIFKEHDCQPRK
jgi:putative FmdB family regulatory protein